jgi:polysaccharide transporter, PST family
VNVPTPPATPKRTPGATASLVGGAIWLGIDRGWRLALGFFVGVLVIRHLGPEGSGLLQSGLALAAILGTGIELGLESILRRELVRRPERTGILLGTATVLRLAALAPALAAFLLIYNWQTHGQQVTLGLLLAVSLALPLLQVFDSWLLATDRMRESTLAGGTALGLGALLRIALLAAGGTVVAFGAATAVETVLLGFCLWLWYRRGHVPDGHWHFDRAEARRLLRDAAPLLFTNLAILVYRRCDLLMVTAQLDNRAAGLYAAAVKLSEVGYIPPMILFNSWFPRLTRLHAEDPARYQAELARFFRIVTWLGLAFAAGGTVAAPWLVRRLFGPAFAEAAAPFAIHVWTAVFIAQGIVRSQWLLLENRLVAGLVLAVAGAATNLALNALLISRLGPDGAALSAVIALALNLVVFTALSRRTRPAWVLGWRALFWLPPPARPERP